MEFTTEEKIIAAKIRMHKSHPFFTYLCRCLEFEQDNNMIPPTMGVDCVGRVRYHGKFVDMLPLEQLKGVIVHEVMHVALQHLSRCGDRDKIVYNVAADLVVNDILIHNNVFLPTGAGALIPTNDHTYTLILPKSRYTIKNLNQKHVLAVYNELMQFLDTQDSKNGNDQTRRDFYDKCGIPFDHHIHSTLTPAEQKEIEQVWNDRLKSASIHAKIQGNMPDSLQRLVEKLTEPKLNWKELIYMHIISELPYDYSWLKPSKRSYTCGVYLPHSLKENVDITVAVDTSGSIGQEELTAFLSEIVGIGQSFENITMTVIACDAEVHEVHTLTRNNIDDVLHMKLSGGGGTSTIPVYKWIEKNMCDSKLLVYLTDGHATFPKQESIKTLWVLTKDGIGVAQIPFGSAVKLTDNETLN